MNDMTREATMILRSVWQRRWTALWVAWGVALLGAAVVWMVPERHEANARIFVDTQTVLKPLMAGLAFQPDVDQQVRMLARTLISRPNVERLVKTPELQLADNDPQKQEAAVESLMRKIQINHVGGGNLFVISYRDTDGARARRVVESMVNLFVDSGQDSKRRDSQEASKFIDEQIRAYESKLIEAENRMKEFKLRNFGVSGVSNQDHFTRMSALSEDVTRLRVSLGAAERSRDALRRELANEEPQLPVTDTALPPLPAATPELDARIDTSRRQMDELLRRYTEQHPDVVALARQIDQLEQQRKAEAERRAALSSARGGRSGMAAAPTSPVYQRLRIALAEAEANVASLQSQLSAQQGRLEDARVTAARVPQVEAEFAQLNRDYDVIRRNYDSLVAKREAAFLGVKIDQNAQIAEFRIVEPPRVLPSPVFPGRKLLALMAALAAIGAGLFVAYARARAFPMFADMAALSEFTKRPVLGSVSIVQDGPARVAARMERLQFLGLATCFFVANSAWVVWVSLQSQV
jgi:polysaccharide chain length determinant protein (PEP-CTERM system associated)